MPAPAHTDENAPSGLRPRARFVFCKLPIDAVPVQRGDDARPHPIVVQAVRSRAPRHHGGSAGRRPSGSGARRPGRIALCPGCGSGRHSFGGYCLGCFSLDCFSLWRLRLGFNGGWPLDIFRSFSGRRSFDDSRCFRCPGRSGCRSRLNAAERKAPITRLHGGGSQNKSCNQNEFTHFEISP